jgi:hypothetical protein
LSSLTDLLARSPRALHTYRLDIRAMFFTGAVLGCVQLLEVIGAKAYGAGAFELALIRSGMGIGMTAAFLVASRIVNRPRVPFVTWPQTVSRVLLFSLVVVPWTPEDWRLPVFCACSVAAVALEFVTIPARLTLYRHNYPIELRPLVASRVRQAQMLTVLLTCGLLGLLIDWNQTVPDGVGLWLGTFLPRDLLPPGFLLHFGIPVVALLSLFGVFLFARIREGVRVRRGRADGSEAPRSGLREWRRALTRNRGFALFEFAYFLFGFGNLMTLPLIVVLVTRPEYGIEASYLESMLVLSVVWQVALIAAAPLMARLVQRYNPFLLRGLLALLFAVDLGLMYVGYTTASLVPLYIGKALRGVSMAGGMLIWELGPMYFARNKDEVPTYVGIHTVLTGVRATISPWVGASLAGAFSLGSAILMGAALQVFAAALLIGFFLFMKSEKLHMAVKEKEGRERQFGQIT